MRCGVLANRVLICLAIGAVTNIVVTGWISSRDRAKYPVWLGGRKDPPGWPNGTPPNWVPPTAHARNELPRIETEMWEYKGPRPDDLFEVIPTFVDRDGSRSETFGGSLSFSGQAASVTPSNRSTSAVLTDLASSEDRTVVHTNLGWPYRCASGTSWLSHKFDAASGTWNTQIVKNSGMLAFKLNPQQPWTKLHPWHPLWLGLIGNIVTFALPPFALWLTWALCMHRFRRESGRCPQCGYAVGWMTTCSECGRVGAAWTQRRMDRFKRRRARRHEGRALVVSAAGLVAICSVVWVMTGLLVEYKSQRYIISTWAASLMFGRADQPWAYPGWALHSTKLHNEWLPRIYQNRQSTQLIIPLWPIFVPLIFMVIRPLWNRAILRAARDTEHALTTRQADAKGDESTVLNPSTTSTHPSKSPPAHSSPAPVPLKAEP